MTSSHLANPCTEGKPKYQNNPNLFSLPPTTFTQSARARSSASPSSRRAPFASRRRLPPAMHSPHRAPALRAARAAITAYCNIVQKSTFLKPGMVSACRVEQPGFRQNANFVISVTVSQAPSSFPSLHCECRRGPRGRCGAMLSPSSSPCCPPSNPSRRCVNHLPLGCSLRQPYTTAQPTIRHFHHRPK